jgi:hypothetical protein
MSDHDTTEAQPGGGPSTVRGPLAGLPFRPRTTEPGSFLFTSATIPPAREWTGNELPPDADGDIA